MLSILSKQFFLYYLSNSYWINTQRVPVPLQYTNISCKTLERKTFLSMHLSNISLNFHFLQVYIYHLCVPLRAIFQLAKIILNSGAWSWALLPFPISTRHNILIIFYSISIIISEVQVLYDFLYFPLATFIWNAVFPLAWQRHI